MSNAITRQIFCTMVRLWLLMALLVTSLMTSFMAMAAETETDTKSTERFESDCLIEPHMLIKVGSPVVGIISRIPVDRGMSIKKGELLAKLQTDIEEISVNLAKEKLNYLVTQYTRTKNLVEKSLASIESLDQVKSEMTLAELELQRRSFILSQKVIKSPVNGVVVNRLLVPGEYVYEQTPIMTIAQTDKLNVEVILPIAVYNKLRLGMKAKVLPEKPHEKEYMAELNVIDKVFDAASSSFGVRLSLPNPDLKIPAGLKCRVVFNW